MPYQVRLARQAAKDFKELTPKLQKKFIQIIQNVLQTNPYQGKKLVGELLGSYSFRLSYKDRIVYQIDERRRIIFIELAKTHYGE